MQLYNYTHFCYCSAEHQTRTVGSVALSVVVHLPQISGWILL